MKYPTLLTVVLIFFLSCHSSTEKGKKTDQKAILSEKRMQEVVYDLLLSESAFQQNLGFPNDKSTARKYFFDYSVLKKNGITRKELDESFLYYSQNPEKLLKIYSNVIDSLSEVYAHQQNL